MLSARDPYVVAREVLRRLVEPALGAGPHHWQVVQELSEGQLCVLLASSHLREALFR